MIAAIYSRKSKFTGKGESIENQIQLCMNYAKNMGITDFIIYEDEGFSGGSTNRPRFQEMLQDAKKKKFNYLICYRLDRISRNVSDFSTLIEELNKLDISFISIKEQFDTSTPMGRAMMYISSVFAQLERETIAERIKDNMYELARTGRWLGGTTPLGFSSTQITYFDENMAQRKMYQLEEDPASLDTVKLIFNKYLELKSLTKLYKYLYNADIRGSRDGIFSPGSVSIVLRNPAYVKADENVINYLRNNNIEVIGSPDNEHGILTYAKNTASPIGAIARHKGVIDSDKWLQVQILLDKNRNKAPRSGTGKGLLSGLLKCSKCGANMRHSYSKTSSGNIVYYYICGTKKSLGASACSCQNIKADIVEEKVIEKIKNTKPENIIDQYKKTKLDNNKNSKEVQVHINKINSSIKDKQNIIDTLVIQLGRNTNSTASTYIINKIEELNKDIENLKNDISTINSVSNNFNSIDLNIELICDSLNRFNSEFDSADLNKRRSLISNIVDHIEWFSEQSKVIVHILGLKQLVDEYNSTIEVNSSLSFCLDSRCSIDKNTNISIYIEDELDESTFGGRLRKSRIEKDLSIKELASICNVTPSVISSYEVNRYYPSIDTLNRLEIYFDINYLCRDGYSNFLWNHDTFINNLKLWINDNGYTRIEAAKLLGVSHSIFRFWFEGSIINIHTYNKIFKKIKQYKLI